MTYIVEELTPKKAVCADEEGKRINIELDKIDGDVALVDVLVVFLGRYRADEALTEQRRKRIIQLQDTLWQ